ncbi:MAG: LytR/AlgR family response regulator transcription factor [Saprospiraceae bacterium]
MVRAILVDDEPKALKSLQNLLQKFCPDIEVVGTANSGEKAYELITGERPQLLFLDVAMPKESGFDLLKRLPSLDFEIIFVTGFDKYAIDAFKFSAIGYILKPIETSDLIKAVHNALARIKTKVENQRNEQLLLNINNAKSLDNKIGIPMMEGLEFVMVKNIIRCEALQRVTKIVIQDQKDLISSYNLGSFIKLLEPYHFFASHRAHLINLAHVKRFHREGTVLMADDSTIPVSRRRRADFLELW